MGSFEIALIYKGPTQVASISRAGLLESGYFDKSGNWVADKALQLVQTDDFGIDSGGNVYFASGGVKAGEEAYLWVDASSDTFSVRHRVSATAVTLTSARASLPGSGLGPTKLLGPSDLLGAGVDPARLIVRIP